MKKLRIAMVGAGSGFVCSIVPELRDHPVFADAEFRLLDIAPDRLALAGEACRKGLDGAKNRVCAVAFTDRRAALDGCDYVITACEQRRFANWAKDIEIPDRHGVHQVMGENGGPGGLIHGLRNIDMFKPILKDMEAVCPEAWLLNFTNPMSILCTYFKNYSPIRALGFCHQVHGTFGLIAEQLGFPPGELEVVSAGVNHLNWLFDIRRRGARESYMDEFLAGVRASEYWKKHLDGIPTQTFTLEVLETFGMYPVGYDEHVIEFMPFFWTRDEWGEKGFESRLESCKRLAKESFKAIEVTRLLGKKYEKPPFPVDNDHPYYKEKPCAAIVALETNTPTYFDAVNIRNHGAVDNLPPDVILDVPALAVGGEVRSVHVGALPPGPLEICRRQTALHEMIARAGHEGNGALAVQALCLDPYVRSLTQARNIWRDYKDEFADLLPSFCRDGDEK